MYAFNIYDMPQVNIIILVLVNQNIAKKDYKNLEIPEQNKKCFTQLL